MRREKLAATFAAGLLAVGIATGPASAQPLDRGSLGQGAGSTGQPAMGSSDPTFGSTGIRVADLPELPEIPQLPTMPDVENSDPVLVPVPLGSVAADLPVLPLPFVWEGTPAPERITPPRENEPVIGSIGCLPGNRGCEPQVLDKEIERCATADQYDIDQRGKTWFTDGTTGWTERCAAEYFG